MICVWIFFLLNTLINHHNRDRTFLSRPVSSCFKLESGCCWLAIFALIEISLYLHLWSHKVAISRCKHGQQFLFFLATARPDGLQAPHRKRRKKYKTQIQFLCYHDWKSTYSSHRRLTQCASKYFQRRRRRRRRTGRDARGASVRDEDGNFFFPPFDLKLQPASEERHLFS